ncbi:hypothetical protein [Obesumbacterium proteus]|uniref:hypothetical protein n=1 Tax=Obesumbacterium proteus TaxID=82983 RepID=UPI001F1C003D|nr:hypothetical protein [Obesumbacterium proteus]MCE9885166.1 hypothetical protein [Obesumbacterium proteus]MCE9914238.1 hypothetical protein [Obesumbacterium proteus]MCE9929336.1 hypothetical protein [Obesumbacterium proteus]MCG2878737.1 hypothetical protein [Obesumbacterium proteus]
MTKLTTEHLEYYAALPTKPSERKAIFMYEVRCMARQLLEYEQAAKNPIAFTEACEISNMNATGLYMRGFPDSKQGRNIPIYAAPVLPKQPELIGMKVSIDTGSDNIGHRLFGEIVGTSDSNGVPVLCIEVAENNGDMAAPAQPVIPEGLLQAINRLLDNDGSRGKFSAVQSYDARENLERLLSPTAQQNEQQNNPTVRSDCISFDALMAAVNEVRGVKREFDATPEKCYQAVPFMNFNSLSRVVEMFRTAQPVSEPYNLPVGYFSYDSECGFDWHKTEKEAIESAEAAIDDYRGDACDGWSEETDSVCWGVILQQATKVDERPCTDDDRCDPAIDTVCDYALLPAQGQIND